MKLIEINEENLTNFIEDIRYEDKKELFYFYRNNFKKNFIKIALENKEAYFLADEDNHPVIIGGVKKRHYKEINIGQVWLLSAKKAKKHKKFLYKYVLDKINLFKNEYDVLFNYIYKSNFKALKWLQKCGFKAIKITEDFKLFYYNKGENSFDIRYITGK